MVFVKIAYHVTDPVADNRILVIKVFNDLVIESKEVEIAVQHIDKVKGKIDASLLVVDVLLHICKQDIQDEKFKFIQFGIPLLGRVGTVAALGKVRKKLSEEQIAHMENSGHVVLAVGI